MNKCIVSITKEQAEILVEILEESIEYLIDLCGSNNLYLLYEKLMLWGYLKEKIAEVGVSE